VTDFQLNVRNATLTDGVSVLHLPLASRAYWPTAFRRTLYRFTGRFALFLGPAQLAVALAGACCSFWLTDLRQPVHHWHSLNSNCRAVPIFFYFQVLEPFLDMQLFGIWNERKANNSKNHIEVS
jgi:hypothetical protein